MKYNLTETQKEVARTVVKGVRDGALGETFVAANVGTSGLFLYNYNEQDKGLHCPGDVAAVRCLEANGMLMIGYKHSDGTVECTITGSIYHAVATNFAESEAVSPVSELAHPHPPELAMPLDRLRSVYPDPKKLGFLIMRFGPGKPFTKIVQVIKKEGARHGLAVVRADEHEFHSGLWENVRTFLHGCGFGIAVYERIETD